MKNERLLLWTTANALGLGMGFVAILNGFDPFMRWEAIPPGQSIAALSGTVACYLLGGLVFGSAQALALRSRLPRLAPWILATTAGFGLMGVLELPLQAAGILGRIPGPVDGR